MFPLPRFHRAIHLGDTAGEHNDNQQQSQNSMILHYILLNHSSHDVSRSVITINFLDRRFSGKLHGRLEQGVVLSMEGAFLSLTDIQKSYLLSLPFLQNLFL